MPTARRTRTIAAPAGELWETIRDPHHLPRWWPRVSRVEDVTEDAFTELLTTAKGKYVRADFALVECDERARRLCWEQRLEGSPFERLLRSATTVVSLREATPRDASDTPGAATPGAQTSEVTEVTEVTIELSQTLRGFLARFGAYMVRRAAARTIEEALDGLARIAGPA